MPDPKVDSYMNAVVDTFTIGKHHVHDALAAIAAQRKILAMRAADAQPYQLLALRRYLRTGGAKLIVNWPWTVAEQKTTYSKVIESLLDAARITKAAFEKANPGFTLGYTRARDLDRQAYLWIDNDSVRVASAGLWSDVRTELAKAQYIPNPGSEGAERFATFLAKSIVQPEPTNAAPGLSDHGQMKAVDFYVDKAGKRVADIKKQLIGSQWHATGFDKQVKLATQGTGLVGPLREPYEPWHYSIPYGVEPKAPSE
ncbi:MAG TPA: hypothetical protein VFG30_01680 [Polyangiales bacterium]|nr:hypothetical protein [Polyangiales bacterium]